MPIAESKAATGPLCQKQSVKGSVYDNINLEVYWECVSCKAGNKTCFGKAFSCEECRKDTFKQSRHLDASREEILIGKIAGKQWWVCGVCKYENYLQNKACLSCHSQRNNSKQVENKIIPGSSQKDECPFCLRRD